MKAFLASTIKRDSTVAALHDFIPGLKNLNMAYVPTAAHAEEGFDVWETGGSWQIAQTLCDNITIVKLEDYRDESVIEELKKHDVVWFAGGLPGYLMYWLIHCGVKDQIQELFANRIYVGISAGSSAAGTELKYLDIYKLGDSEPAAAYLPGLRLLDREFYPHYSSDDLPRIEREYAGKGMYLVPDGEQIIIDGEEIKLSAGVEVLDK